jgi:hypothetical protein
MWNGSNFALFRLKVKKIFMQNGRILVVTAIRMVDCDGNSHGGLWRQSAWRTLDTIREIKSASKFSSCYQFWFAYLPNVINKVATIILYLTRWVEIECHPFVFLAALTPGPDCTGSGHSKSQCKNLNLWAVSERSDCFFFYNINYI